MLKEVIILVEILISVYISILFHEFGHFVVAKILGVKVAEFSVGGGRKLFSFTFNKTKYTLNSFITLINHKVSFGASGFCNIDVLVYFKASSSLMALNLFPFKSFITLETSLPYK